MKFLKTLGKLLLGLVILGAVAMLVIFLGQNILKYPGKGFSGTPTDWNSRLGAVQNRGYPAIYAPGGTENIQVRALWSQSREGTVPALLWMHGRSEDITDTLSTIGPMAERKFHVLSMEYPGYGDAEGDTTEANILAHAEAAFDYLTARDDVAPRRVYVGGFDLGAAVALKLAARKDAAGVIAFGTLPDMAIGVSSRLKGVPVGFLLRDRFLVEPILTTVPAPVLFVHGTADELVPISDIEGISARLSKSRVMPVEGAGHDNLVAAVTKEQWDDIALFVFEGLR
jgi:uncharacterized protein